MFRLRHVLRSLSSSNAQSAAATIAGLPAYQVALWPDGWDLSPEGAVTVRDTHAMAEARRWYRLAERNRSHDDGRRVMHLHGIFIPRSVLDLVHRRFPSEQVASVALQLVAGDWIKERRRQLMRAPERELRARALAWSGSRYRDALDSHDVLDLVERLLGVCASERLIPAAEYRIAVEREDAFGIPGWRCRVGVCLDPYARARVREALCAALVPWNRAVMHDGTPMPIIDVVAAAPRSSSR